MDFKDTLIETDRYIYSNWFTKSITLWGHRVCSKLREFDTEGSMVVDLGCGPGVHFKYIKYANFVGIDRLPEMVDRAEGESKKSGGRGSAVLADLYSYPFTKYSVDSVIASGILEHLSSLDSVVGRLQEILRPGGEIIVLQSCEGPLYKLGRRLTTQRHIGPSYSDYISKEHSWNCREVLNALDRSFIRDRLVGVPFGLPIVGLNIYVAGRYTKTW